MKKISQPGTSSKSPLSANEPILHNIIDGSFIPGFVIDRDRRVICWNKALEEISQIRADAVIGTKNHWKAFYKEERPCMADLLVDGAVGKIPQWYAGKYRKSPLIEDAFEATDFFPDLGNTGRWLRFTASTIRNDRGEIIGAAETLEDITDQKKAEDALRDSEEKLYNILQGSPIAAFVIDRSHHVMFWNRALEELSRIRSDDIVGTDYHWRAFYASRRPCMADLIVDGKLDGVRKWYAEKGHPSKLLPEAFEATDFFPDLGEAGRWLRFTAAAIRNARGELEGAVETLEDITDQKTAETSRRDSEQRLESILQGSPIPMFVIGRDHEVIFWNRALEGLSQIPAKEVVGTNQQWRAFYNEERPCMADLLLDGKIRDIPQWYQGKYSKSRLVPEAYEATDYFPSLRAGKWMRFTAATIRDSNGQIIGALETLEDITERKRGEIALQKAYEELEQRVEERTYDLLQSSQALKAENTERKEAEKKLRKRERELKIKSGNLEEMNTALKVLLEQRDKDKREAEEMVLGNVKELLSPYIEKLKKTRLSDMQTAHLGVIESNLENIISPFLKNIHGKHLNMTPKEIRIASLIKEGRTTKEIAALLGMSSPAVEFHRNNIRNKLGLKNKKANLAAHLASLLEG